VWSPAAITQHSPSPAPARSSDRRASSARWQARASAGRPTLAIERVLKALGGEPISVLNLDLHYWLARAHDAAGSRAEALALFKKIQAEDLHFRDVNERVSGTAAPAAPARPASAPAPVAAAAAAPRGPRFVPREEIGRGPLGVVHRGEDTTDGRAVSMRMIPPALFAAPGLLQALAADLKAAAQVSHPNVVKLIAFMEWKGERCVVSEHVPGRNFAEAIASGRRMPFQQVHALGRICAQVLVLLHGRGLVHGSLQPSNVMVASGVIKVADLGLGRLAHAHPAQPSYHAPEGGLSVPDDLYALCAVMYHLLTGAHPRSQAQGVGLPLPSQLAPGVPEAMDKLLLRGLHPRPELRLSGADDLLRELREMVRIG